MPKFLEDIQYYDTSGTLHNLSSEFQTLKSTAYTTSRSPTKTTVGLSNVANERQYSSNNPPPYPVTSVNGKTGAVTISIPSSPKICINSSIYDSSFVNYDVFINCKCDWGTDYYCYGEKTFISCTFGNDANISNNCRFVNSQRSNGTVMENNGSNI